MSNNYVISKIVQDQLVTEYLASKNIFPTFSGGDKWMYNCPSKDHNDSDPSFSVFTIDGKQYFKCFGCGIKGDILNLYMLLEDMDMKSAINALGGDLGYTYDDELKYNMSKLESDSPENGSIDIKKMNEINFWISRRCYMHLSKYGFDDYEVQFIKRIYKKINHYIYTLNSEKLKYWYENLYELVDLGTKHNRPKFRK